MNNKLDHLTDEEQEEILKIYPKLQSTNEGSKDLTKVVNVPANPEVDKTKQELKEGYTEYETKTKQSDRLSYQDDEIEIIEEDIE